MLIPQNIISSSFSVTSVGIKTENRKLYSKIQSIPLRLSSKFCVDSASDISCFSKDFSESLLSDSSSVLFIGPVIESSDPSVMVVKSGRGSSVMPEPCSVSWKTRVL